MTRKKKVDNTESQDLRTVLKSVKVDWNKWHQLVKDSIDAFDIDTAVDYCDKLGIQFKDGELIPVRAGTIRSCLESLAETLIKLHDIKWSENAEYATYTLYESCYVIKDDCGLHGNLNLVAYGVETISDPMIEIYLRLCDNNDPWFDINFNLVSQVF